MNLNDFRKIGFIEGAYGIKGEVKLIFETDVENKLKIKEPVFIEINKKPVPFFIEKLVKKNNNSLIAKLEGVDTVEQCNDISLCSLYLPENLFEQNIELPFTYKELIGFDVYEDEIMIGNISNVLSYPQQQIAQFYLNGKEILIPLNQKTIKKVDYKSRRLYVNLPQGLIDVYA